MNKKLTKKQINYLKSFKEGDALIYGGDFYFFKDLIIWDDYIEFVVYDFDGTDEFFEIKNSKDLEILRKYGEEDYLTAIDFERFTEFSDNFAARFGNINRIDKFLQNFEY